MLAGGGSVGGGYTPVASTGGGLVTSGGHSQVRAHTHTSAQGRPLKPGDSPWLRTLPAVWGVGSLLARDTLPAYHCTCQGSCPIASQYP